MNTRFEQERQAKVVIDKYRQQAINAERLRLARDGRPDPLSSIAMNLSATIAATMSTIQTMFHRASAASPEPNAEPEVVSVQEPVGEAADIRVVA